MPSPHTPLITNADVKLNRRLYRIPATSFVVDEVATDALGSLGVGAPVITEISTFGIAGFAMAANDEVHCYALDFLQNVDVTAAIDVRVLWTTNGAPVATDGATFIVLYDLADAGEALIEPATALDTTLAEHLDGGTTAYIFHRTAAGVIDADTFDEEAKRGCLSFEIELQAVTTFDADQVIVMGLELAYTPQYFADVNVGNTKHTLQGAV